VMIRTDCVKSERRQSYVKAIRHPIAFRISILELFFLGSSQNSCSTRERQDGHSSIYIGGGVLVYAGSYDTGGVPKAQTLNYAGRTPRADPCFFKQNTSFLFGRPAFLSVEKCESRIESCFFVFSTVFLKSDRSESILVGRKRWPLVLVGFS
jgi:hypothetical protein